MAVVSLSAFDPAEIPGIPSWRLFPKSDESSYAQIWAAVRNVAYNCLSKFLTADDNPSQLSAGLKFVSDTGWDVVGEFCIFLLCSLEFLS